MFLFHLISRSLPTLVTFYVIFTAEPILSCIALLLLFLINRKYDVTEDLGRIEHKIDSIAASTLSTEELKSNYLRLHGSAWDHEYPMTADEDLSKLAKKRNDTLIAIDVIQSALWYILFVVLFVQIFF